MTRFVWAALAAVTVLVAAGLCWRLASRTRRLPCPSWLAWLLENPLIDVIAGTGVTLDRIGLQPGERGLDVRSGPGRLALPAARRVGPSGTIVALDVQPGMLAGLEARAARMRDACTASPFVVRHAA